MACVHEVSCEEGGSTRRIEHYATKVPAVTLVLDHQDRRHDAWRDRRRRDEHDLNWGYLVGTAIFRTLLAMLVVAANCAKKFHPLLYWATIVASTTAGTTMADFADRSSASATPAGRPAVSRVMAVSPCGTGRRHGLGANGEHAEGRNLLLGHDHLFADAGHGAGRLDRGYAAASATRAAPLVFGAALVGARGPATTGRSVSRVMLFWAAFILTRPLGATVGDFLDKPISHGGLDFKVVRLPRQTSRLSSSGASSHAASGPRYPSRGCPRHE